MGVGLAIGMDAMRACKVFPAWEGMRLWWCGAAPLPGELIAASAREENIASVARFRGVLTDVFQGLIFRGRLQVGLPDASVRVRLLFTEALPEDPAARRKYLLWRLAETLGFPPRDARLAYTALPSPLPGHRHAVLCAVSEAKVIQQYERALAESKVRYTGIVPSSVLLFNLFCRHLTGPPGAPILLLAATEASSTTVMTVDGLPIFWRTRLLAKGAEGHGLGSNWHGEMRRDVAEAIVYVEDVLGVRAPAHVYVTGPLAEEPGLADWLAQQVGLPVDALDAGRLVRQTPRRAGGEGLNRWGVALGAAARQ